MLIEAQRQIEIVNTYLGSQSASYHRRLIENLCQQINCSLEQNDERTWERVVTDLVYALDELYLDAFPFDEEEKKHFTWEHLAIENEQLLKEKKENGRW